MEGQHGKGLGQDLWPSGELWGWSGLSDSSKTETEGPGLCVPASTSLQGMLSLGR